MENKASIRTERAVNFQDEAGWKGISSKGIKLKSLILAQIERWRHA